MRKLSAIIMALLGGSISIAVVGILSQTAEAMRIGN